MNKPLTIGSVILVLTFGWCYSAVTPSEQCSGLSFDDLRERIQVLPCGKTKCKLRKGTDITVNFRFNPKTEVRQLRNNVYAKIAGLPLPFIGVDGVSACKDIRTLDGKPAPCPLAPNQEYLYTNMFHVERFYPSVPLTVHWALNDGKSDVICFEVAAAIL